MATRIINGFRYRIEITDGDDTISAMHFPAGSVLSQEAPRSTVLVPHGTSEHNVDMDDADALALAKFLLQHHGREDLAVQL